MIRNKRTCVHCEKEISASNYEKHIRVCLQNSIQKQDFTFAKLGFDNSNPVQVCPFCQKSFPNKGIMTHIWRIHGDGKNHNTNIGYQNGTRTVWNKNLTASTDERVALIAKKNAISQIGRKASENTRKKLSLKAKARGFGGHTSRYGHYHVEPSGRKIFLQSKYELKVAQELDLHNISWVRPEPLLWFDEEGEDHRYYPDFYLPLWDVYLDPKNDFLIKQDGYKIKAVSKQNNVRIIVLNKKQLAWTHIISIIQNPSIEEVAFTDTQQQSAVLICKNCNKNINVFSKTNLCKKCFFAQAKKRHFCKNCSCEITKDSKTQLCASCRSFNDKRPSKEQLQALIATTPFTQIGKTYGVSDNAIRKWCKDYDLPVKRSEIKQLVHS